MGKQTKLKPFESKESGIVFVGKSKYGEYYEAREAGRAYGYQPVYAENNSTEHDAIECVSCVDLPKDLLPLTAKDRKFLGGAFKCDFNFISCEECGFQHDGDDYHPDFTIRECSAYCLECVPDELKLQLVESPEDIFKAPRVAESSLPEYFEEVETLFCDSSGWGNENEPALTQNGTRQAVKELLAKHKTLYAGLTGCGQFQVYVTLYKKNAPKKTRKAKRGAPKKTRKAKRGAPKKTRKAKRGAK